MEFISKDDKETQLLGEMLGRALKPGSIILATGPLGAGKTCFAQGLARGLGLRQKVNSPTFNIIKEYRGEKINFYHIDAYRLESPEAVSDIGFEEIFGDDEAVSYIEWPEFIGSYLKGYKNVIKVSISLHDTDRLIDISGDSL